MACDYHASRLITTNLIIRGNIAMVVAYQNTINNGMEYIVVPL